jgi:hypothetical protein
MGSIKDRIKKTQPSTGIDTNLVNEYAKLFEKPKEMPFPTGGLTDTQQGNFAPYNFPASEEYRTSPATPQETKETVQGAEKMAQRVAEVPPLQTPKIEVKAKPIEEVFQGAQEKIIADKEKREQDIQTESFVDKSLSDIDAQIESTLKKYPRAIQPMLPGSGAQMQMNIRSADEMDAENKVRKLNQARKIFEDFKDYKNNPSTFWQGLKQSDWYNVLTGGLQSLAETANLKVIADKSANNQPLSEEEQSVLNATALLNKLKSEKESSLGYDVAQTVVNMIPFITQIGLTGGVGNVVAGGRELLKQGMKQYLKKLPSSLLKYSMSTAPKTLAMPMLYQDLARRQTGQIQMGDQGAYALPAEKSLPEAFIRSYLSTYIERGSEGIGSIFDDLGSVGINYISKKLGKTLLFDNRAINFANDFRKNIGLNSVPGEMSEEFFAGLTQPLVDDEQKFSDTFNQRTIAEIFLSSLIPSSLMKVVESGGNYVTITRPYKKAEQNLSIFGEDAQYILDANSPDNFNERMIANGAVTQLADTPEKRAAMLDYFNRKVQYDILKESLTEDAREKVEPMINKETGQIHPVTTVNDSQVFITNSQDGFASVFNPETNQIDLISADKISDDVPDLVDPEKLIQNNVNTLLNSQDIIGTPINLQGKEYIIDQVNGEMTSLFPSDGIGEAIELPLADVMSLQNPQEPLGETAQPTEVQQAENIQQPVEQINPQVPVNTPQTWEIGNKTFSLQPQEDGSFIIPFEDGKDNTKIIEKEIDEANFEIIPITEEVAIPNAPTFAKKKTQTVIKGVRVIPKQLIPTQNENQTETQADQIGQEGMLTQGQVPNAEPGTIRKLIDEQKNIKNAETIRSDQGSATEEGSTVGTGEETRGNDIQFDQKTWPKTSNQVRKTPIGVAREILPLLQIQPETFEQGLLQYFLSGGRINREQFKKYSGLTNNKDLIYFFSILKNEGQPIDTINEVVDTFGKLTESMDLINEVVSIITSNPGKRAMGERLKFLFNTDFDLNPFIEEAEAEQQAINDFAETNELPDSFAETDAMPDEFWMNLSQESEEDVQKIFGTKTQEYGQENIPQGQVQNNAVETPSSEEVGRTEEKVAEIAAEEAKVNTEPTEAQKEAGNYQKGHVSIQGLDISIENPKGSIRSGTDRNGNDWQIELQNTYGYFRGTEGKDKDHVDVFLGNNPLSEKVWVIDQVESETGKFDEHKVLMGFESEEEARNAYLSNYQPGWKGLGAITELPMNEFKDWLFSGKVEKPLGKIEKPEEAQKESGISDISLVDGKSYVDKDGNFKSIVVKIVPDKIGGYLTLIDKNGKHGIRPMWINSKDILENINSGEWIEKPEALTKKPQFAGSFLTEKKKPITFQYLDGTIITGQVISEKGGKMTVRSNDGVNYPNVTENMIVEPEDIRFSIGESKYENLTDLQKQKVEQRTKELTSKINSLSKEVGAAKRELQAKKNELSNRIVSQGDLFGAPAQKIVEQSLFDVKQDTSQETINKALEPIQANLNNKSVELQNLITKRDELVDDIIKVEKAQGELRLSIDQKTPIVEEIYNDQLKINGEWFNKSILKNTYEIGDVVSELMRKPVVIENDRLYINPIYISDEKWEEINKSLEIVGFTPRKYEEWKNKFNKWGAGEITNPDHKKAFEKAFKKELNIKPIDKTERNKVLIKAAKKYFGTTNNFKESGYLTTDGKLLDFSGRHEGNTINGVRYVDHREIQSVESKVGSTDMIDFMSMGNIRMESESDGFEITKPPTPEQVKILKQYISQTKQGVLVDFSEPGQYNTIFSVEYPSSIKPERVINDINNYYNNGVKPVIGGGIRFSLPNNEVFYINSEKALNNIQQSKGTAEQFKAMLLKNGAKQDELDWMGWDEFAKDKKLLTKDEIQNWIDENKVEVKEIVRGDYQEPKKYKQLDEMPDDVRDLVSRQIEKPYPEFENDIEKLGYTANYEDGIIKSISKEGDNIQLNNTKYSQYTIPGGKNYKEVLLTLPVKLTPDEIELRALNKKSFSSIPMTDEEVRRGSELQAKIKDSLKEKLVDKSFKSSHFDEPNIAVHIRMNEFTTKDGKRALNIEEIQSDWAQKGKKEGFGIDKEKQQANINFKNYTKSLREKYNKNSLVEIEQNKLWSQEEISEYNRLKDLTKGNYGYDSSVPNMPFKKTDQWAGLGMKWALRYAAENGFDVVTWTTGETQSERYDLSKQISLVEYYPHNNVLVAEDTNGMVAIDERVSEDKIEDYIGKDATKKLLTSELTITKSGNKKYTISGENLKIDSEGMKGFYDQILPAWANKYVKKWGAKVGQTQIESEGNSVDVHLIKLTPEMKESVLGGQPMFKIGDESSVNSKQQLQSFYDELNAGAPIKVVSNVDEIITDYKESGGTSGFIIFELQQLKGLNGVFIEGVDKIYVTEKVYLKETLWIHENGIHFGVRLTLPERKTSRKFFNELFDLLGENKVRFAMPFYYANLQPYERSEEYLAYKAEQNFNEGKIDIDNYFESEEDILNLMDQETITDEQIDKLINTFVRNSFNYDTSRNITNRPQDRGNSTSTRESFGRKLRPIYRPSQEGNVPIGSLQGSNKRFAGELIKRPQTESPQFKNWFGQSKIVDEKGKPQVYYHATGENFDVFKPNDKGVIFASPDKNWVQGGFMPLDKEQSTSGSVMPVYIKAENPFDYRNPEHLSNLLENLDVRESIQEHIRNGRPMGIEKPVVIEKIKELGYDSLYVTEEGITNIGVFEPTQVKSSLGNKGAFDKGNPNVLFSLDEKKMNTNSYTDEYFVDKDYKPIKGSLFLRFTDDSKSDIVHKYSRWYENDLTENEAKNQGYLKDEFGYYKLHTGLSGHQLKSENLNDAISEAKSLRGTFKNINSDNWSIFESNDEDFSIKQDTPEGNTFSAFKVLFDRKFNNPDIRASLPTKTLNFNRGIYYTENSEGNEIPYTGIAFEIRIDYDDNNGDPIFKQVIIDPTEAENELQSEMKGFNNFQSKYTNHYGVIERLKIEDGEIVDSIPMDSFDLGTRETSSENLDYEVRNWLNSEYGRDKYSSYDNIILGEDKNEKDITLQIRVKDHSENPRNKGVYSLADYYLSIVIANKNETAERFNSSTELYFTGDNNLEDVKEEVSNYIQNIINDSNIVKLDTKIKNAGYELENIRFSISEPPAIIPPIPPKKQFAGSFLIPKGKFKPLTRFEKFQEALQDRMLRVKKLQEDLKVTNTTDIYKTENLSSSRANASIDKFNDDLFTPIINTFGEFDKLGKDAESVQLYLKAKHAIERNKWMREQSGVEKVFAGLSDEEAQKIIDEFELSVPEEKINTLWKQINKATDFTLNKYVEYGFMTKETREEIKARNWDHYVPLRGWELTEEEKELDQRYNSPTGAGSLNPIKKAKGRETESDDPLPYIASMAHSIVAMGEKNRVKQSAVKLVMNNKDRDDLFYMKKVYRVQAGVDETGKPFYEEVFDPEENAIPVTNKMHEYKKERSKWKQHEVEAYINGNKYVAVFADPTVAQAINYENQFQPEVTRAFQQTIGKVTRWLSSNFTAKNPAFIPVNGIRDIAYASIAMDTKHGLSPVKYIQYINESKNTILRYFSKKTTKDPRQKQLDEYYKEFKEWGGETGYVHLFEIDDLKKQIDRQLRILNNTGTRAQKAYDFVNQAKYIQAAGKLLERMAILSENMSRFATYSAMRDQGKTPMDSAYAAKEITVNFNRKGTMTGALGSIYAFFNASIQGGANALGIAKEHKGKFIAVSSSFMAMGVLNAILASLWDDDDKYKNINDYIKQTNLIIPKGLGSDSYISIPLPQFFRQFFAAGVLAVQAIGKEKTPEQAGSEILSNVFESISPVNPVGFINKKGPTGGLDLARPFIPTIGTPVLDLIMNEDFAGKRIVNTPFTRELEENMASSQRYTRGTNPVLIEIFDNIYKLGGGDMITKEKTYYDFEDKEFKKVPLLSDINPSSVEHIIEYYTGGRGKFFSDLIKLTAQIGEGAQKTIQGKEFKEVIGDFNANSVPILNRFQRTLYTNPAGDRLRTFYNEGDELQRFKRQREQYKKAGEYEKYGQMMSEPEFNKRINLFESFKGSVDDFNDLIKKSEDEKFTKMLKEQRDEIIKEYFKIKSNDTSNTD